MHVKMLLTEGCSEGPGAEGSLVSGLCAAIPIFTSIVPLPRDCMLGPTQSYSWEGFHS